MSLPHMPLWIGDYLADTSHLTTREHGAYLLLIMHYWRNDGLPTDDRALARIARLPFRDWNALRGNLSAFFDDNWKHKRIEAELAHARRISELGKRAAQASVQARRAKSAGTSTPDVNGDATPVERPLDAAATHAQPPQSQLEKKIDDGGDARASRSIISREASAIADEVAKIAGHEPAFVPPSWCGAAMRVETWLQNGWSRELIVETAKATMAKKRDGPPATIRYFEKPIAKAFAALAQPLPSVVAPSPETVHVGPARIQADRSLVAASERILARMREFDEPGGGGAGGEDAVRLLPPR